MSTAEDLAVAQAQLAAARVNLAEARTAKSYRIGSRSKESHDISHLLQEIRYWENEVARLSGHGRVFRPIVRN